jgi:hypothetical protein
MSAIIVGIKAWSELLMDRRPTGGWLLLTGDFTQNLIGEIMVGTMRGACQCF